MLNRLLVDYKISWVDPNVLHWIHLWLSDWITRVTGSSRRKWYSSGEKERGLYMNRWAKFYHHAADSSTSVSVKTDTPAETTNRWIFSLWLAVEWSSKWLGWNEGLLVDDSARKFGKSELDYFSLLASLPEPQLTLSFRLTGSTPWSMALCLRSYPITEHSSTKDVFHLRYWLTRDTKRVV
jgi:hypothetical protein